MTSRCVSRSVIVLMLTALLVAATARPTISGPGEAGRGGRVSRTSAPNQVGADYVVLVWYRDDDALRTFAYQTYDVRKGEYTPAVDDWLALLKTKYPHYVVRALPVYLARERGDTEKLRVGSVIHRELLLAAARSGVILGAPMSIGPGPNVSQRPAPRPNLWTEIPGAGGASNLNPPGGTMPFPIPYPRPHP